MVMMMMMMMMVMILSSKLDETSQNGSTGRKRSASLSEMAEPSKRRPSFERGSKGDPSTNGVTRTSMAFNDDDLSFT